MDGFKTRVLETISKHGLIKRGDRVCAAVSGGADSMALLCFLMEVRKETGLILSAVNIEHGIRGRESVRDSEFVKGFCKERDIPLQIFLVDAPKHARDTKQGIEAAARELRYRCFEKMRGGNDRLALAHHRGDQAETVLLRLFRGGGAGISGMDYVRDNFYIRPFLDVSKDEIREYALQNNIPFVTDSSNSDNSYDRNFVRNNILTAAGERFPGCEAALARAAAHIRADNLYIESMLPPVVFEGGEAGVDFEYFGLPDAIVNRLLFKAFAALGVETDIEERHISLIKGLQRDGESGAEIMLPHRLRAIKDYARVTIAPRGDDNKAIYGMPFSEALNLKEIAFGARKITFEFISRKEYNGSGPAAARRPLYADGAAIPAGAIIRQRQDGDRFKKFGGGRVPLSDFFIDRKVPARHRGLFPLIAGADGEIFCICGMEISDKVKVTDKTKQILKITIE